MSEPTEKKIDVHEPKPVDPRRAPAIANLKNKALPAKKELLELGKQKRAELAKKKIEVIEEEELESSDDEIVITSKTKPKPEPKKTKKIKEPEPESESEEEEVKPKSKSKKIKQLENEINELKQKPTINVQMPQPPQKLPNYQAEHYKKKLLSF